MDLLVTMRGPVVEIGEAKTRIYCGSARLLLSESRVELEFPHIIGVSEGEEGNRGYIYIDLEEELKVDSLFEGICGKRRSSIIECFMFQCHSLSVGPMLVIVTPGHFRYERVIVTPFMVVVEFIGRKAGRVRVERGRVTVDF